MTSLNLNQSVCNEHNLRFVMRDLRNKMTLMEMTDQRSTLRDKENTPQRITSIENKKHRIQLGANGMISSVALLDGNTIPKKMFEVYFN
jgi:hypothetical protein